MEPLEPSIESQPIPPITIDPKQIIDNATENFQSIPDDMRPKPAYLKPWFSYFAEMANKKGIDQTKLTQICKEFTTAHVLKQWIFDWYSSDINKPKLMEIGALESNGIDPDRLVRYLVLQATFPKGIDLNNDQIVFNLEEEDLSRLFNNIGKVLEGVNLTKDQLLRDFGFMPNPNNPQSYFKRVNQKEFEKMLNEIFDTY